MPAPLNAPNDDRATPDSTADVIERFVERDARATKAWIARGHRFLADERHRRLRDIVARELSRVENPRILDVGCGGGQDLEAWLIDGWPPSRLAGIDLVAGRIEAARSRVPGVDLRVGNGTELPYADAAFEVATAATVFSSILDPRVRRSLFDAMVRVTRPGGIVVVYDFVVRKPSNHDVLPMTPARLRDLAGRPPDESIRLGPFLYAVGAGLTLHPSIGVVIARVVPRTHRLSVWRV